MFGVLGGLGNSELASADTRLAKGPYLTGLTDKSVEVRFELDSPTPVGQAVAVSVTADGQPGHAAPARVFQSLATTSLRVVHLADLAPDTRYAYSVRLSGAVVGSGHFATAPRDEDRPVTFLLYGDDRTDPSAHASVVRAMADVPSDFLVSTGDLVADGGSASDWQSFFDVEGAMLRDRPLFVAIGNHELYDDNAGSNFAKYFGFLGSSGVPTLYGTARFGSVRFFFINGMHDWSAGDERDWLVKELEQADGEAGVVWRIGVTHHSPWSSGPHGPNTSLIAAHIPELLAAHHVDLLLAGHDHIYDRGDGNGLKYIVSGGGGAPLYRVLENNSAMRKAEATYHFVEVTADAHAIRITAHRIDGTILDRCGFKKGTSWDCDPPRVGAPAYRDAEEPSAAPAPPPPSQCGCSIRGAKTGRLGSAVGLALGLFLFARLSTGGRTRRD